MKKSNKQYLWTNEKIKEIISLYTSGKRVKDLVALFHTTKKRIATILDEAKITRHNTWTPERKNKAVTAYKSGKTIKEVSVELKTNAYNVAKVLDEASIDRHNRDLFHDRYVEAARKRAKNPKRVWTIERDIAVAELYLSDWLQSEIADYFKSSTGRVSDSLVRSEIRLPRTGRRNPAWKGGRNIDKDGYVLLYDPDHPNARKNGYILEHRLEMSKQLNRPLTKEEVVHHEQKKIDNKAKNLRLFANNAEHLRHELTGKVPKWTEEGRARLREVVRGPRKRSTKRLGLPKTDVLPSQ